MSEVKRELIGKRFQVEGKILTVYGVTDYGVFAHEGDIMETNEKGEVLNPRYFDYEKVEPNLVTAGRPSIGTTKKVSLTLSDEIWDMIEKRKEAWGANQSQTLRMMIEGYFTPNRFGEEIEMVPVEVKLIEDLQRLVGNTDEVYDSQDVEDFVHNILTKERLRLKKLQ